MLHPHDGVLDRIRAHQRGAFDATPFSQALSEIQAGKKTSHWIWYVWPSLRGVRRTQRSDLELPSFECAQAYLRDAELVDNLVAITLAASAQLARGIKPQDLFGAMHAFDAPKFAEACTLFLLAAQLNGQADLAAIFYEGLGHIGKGQLNGAVVGQLRKLGTPELQMQLAVTGIPAPVPVDLTTARI
jgi:uncharacterized protein (DUF1810 family)